MKEKILLMGVCKASLPGIKPTTKVHPWRSCSTRRRTGEYERSTRVVFSPISRCIGKLGVQNKTEAVAKARALGLISSP
ncbi:MAG: hypothetical protein V3V57_04850 [Spirochaetia bacterium]